MERAADILRGCWQLGLAWLFNAVYIPLLLLILLLGGRRRRWRIARAMVRTWSRCMLWIVGVDVVLEAPATWPEGGRSVLAINHASTLDMLVVGAHWPLHGSGIVKREFLSLPLLGAAARAIGLVPVDRGSHERSLASMARAAERMRAEDLSVLVAPEGTRNPTDELLPFKPGALHLAKAADAPVIPLVLYGPRRLWPRDRLSSRAGTVTVRQLPSLVLRDTPAGELRAVAERLRATYAETLQRMDAELPDPERKRRGRLGSR